MPPRIVAPALLYLAIIAACIATVSALSCGATSTNCSDPAHSLDTACVAKNILVECAGSDTAGVIAQYTPIVEDIISKGVLADGTISWAIIGTDLISAVAKYGWCVVSSVFEHYMNPPTVGSGSGSNLNVAVQGGTAAKPHPTPQAARDTFNTLRSKVWPQAKFHTAGATL